MEMWEWDMACHSQSACNLSGLAHDLQGKLPNLDANGQDDYSRLLVAQMAYLSHGGLGDTKDTPLDPKLPTDFAELVNGLVETVKQARERHKDSGTDAVNKDSKVKKWVRALCEICHGGSDPFGWRWEIAYKRAQLRSDKNPYSDKEELTKEKVRELLAELNTREIDHMQQELPSVQDSYPNPDSVSGAGPQD